MLYLKWRYELRRMSTAVCDESMMTEKQLRNRIVLTHTICQGETNAYSYCDC
jgi:hypothetical protein